MNRVYFTKKGTRVIQPRNKTWIAVLVVFLLLLFFWQFISFNPNLIRLNQFESILIRLFSPGIGRDWNDYFSFMLNLSPLLLETINMSFAGTIIGSLFAIPLAIISSRNIFKIKIVYSISRFLMNIIRTVPTMVLALISVFMVGTGILAGIIAITLFSFGIMSKMLYELIETVDMNPFETLESSGANKVQAFNYSVVPQILPVFVSYLIYVFEINVRASAVLGYVGAGGIGSAISGNILYNYDRVGGTIIVMLLTILAVQILSNFLRGKLQWTKMCP